MKECHLSITVHFEKQNFCNTFSDFVTNSYGESWDSSSEQIMSPTPETLRPSSNTTETKRNLRIDRSIDLCRHPTESMHRTFERLWGFLCVRDVGRRGNKITALYLKTKITLDRNVLKRIRKLNI